MFSGVTNAITGFITSPPGQITAGAALAGATWKSFKEIEDVLNDDAKAQVADWLQGLRTEPKVRSWPDTFAAIIDQFLGPPRWSNKRLWILSITFYILILCNLYVAHFAFFDRFMAVIGAAALLVVIVAGTYGGLVERRLVLRARSLVKSDLAWFLVFTLNLLVDILGGSVLMGLLLRVLSGWLPDSWHDVYLGVYPSILLAKRVPLMLVPMLFFSFSLWIYGAAGLLIKGARNIDLGVRWFNRWFDIREKPLRSVGMVAALLVAVLYWSAASII